MDCGDMGTLVEQGIYALVFKTGMPEPKTTCFANLVEALVTTEYGVTLPILRGESIMLILN